MTTFLKSFCLTLALIAPLTFLFPKLFLFGSSGLAEAPAYAQCTRSAVSTTVEAYYRGDLPLNALRRLMCPCLDPPLPEACTLAIEQESKESSSNLQIQCPTEKYPSSPFCV